MRSNFFSKLDILITQWVVRGWPSLELDYEICDCV